MKPLHQPHGCRHCIFTGSIDNIDYYYHPKGLPHEYFVYNTGELIRTEVDGSTPRLCYRTSDSYEQQSSLRLTDVLLESDISFHNTYFTKSIRLAYKAKHISKVVIDAITKSFASDSLITEGCK